MQLFPFANTVAAIAILVVAFGFHFVGQTFSVLNWRLACRLGLQEVDSPSDYYPYEHGTAVGDMLLGWIYPIAPIGLLLDAEWAYKLAWIPGAILLYHGVSSWFWEADRRAAGHQLQSDAFRAIWCGANILTGLIAILVAWTGPTT